MRLIITTTTLESTQTKKQFNIYKFLAKVTICYVLIRMSALQNTVSRKVGNPCSHLTEQPQKGYKKS